MNLKMFRSRSLMAALRCATAVLCVMLIASGDSVVFAQQAGSTSAAEAKIPNDQLDSLVAPIALYPDPLLGQILVASTYPLEIAQLYQWLQKNPTLKGSELTAAVEKQDWDPSIQAMAAFPDVVKNMAENIRWTADLGNAFLAQQSDVMDAVQRMRMRAKDSGTLKSTQQQTVETQTAGNKTVVVIEPSNPDVVYVPAYDPMAVWGAPAYPYPPVYYPSAGYVAAASAISFGIGVAIGAAWGGGGWGWGCGWGGSNININYNNAFVRHYNQVNRGNRYGGAGNNWQHNPRHRGGAPYGDRVTAQRFGGTTRGASPAARQAAARQNLGRTPVGGANPGNIGGGANRGPAAGGANPSNIGGGANRGPAAGGVGNRGPAAVGSANRAIGGDQVGNRQVPRPSPGGNNAFSGASGGFNGRNAGQSSMRGRSSMGGGFSRGGGGGARRGGGGRRR